MSLCVYERERERVCVCARAYVFINIVQPIVDQLANPWQTYSVKHRLDFSFEASSHAV